MESLEDMVGWGIGEGRRNGGKDGKEKKEGRRTVVFQSGRSWRVRKMSAIDRRSKQYQIVSRTE